MKYDMITRKSNLTREGWFIKTGTCGRSPGSRYRLTPSHPDLSGQWHNVKRLFNLSQLRGSTGFSPVSLLSPYGHRKLLKKAKAKLKKFFCVTSLKFFCWKIFSEKVIKKQWLKKIYNKLILISAYKIFGADCESSYHL